MIVAKPFRHSGLNSASCPEHADAVKLDRMALAIVEADGFDSRETLKRPSKADGGILPAGKQHQGRVFRKHAQSHFGDQAQSVSRPSERARPAISRISCALNSKSKIAIFSASRSTLLVRGIAPMPC